MMPLRDNRIHRQGFSLAELLVVLGVISILAVIALPVFVNVLQTQQARGAAQELVSLLNQAKQMAIARNALFRVEVETEPNGNRLRFRWSTDGGTTYTTLIGPGTDDQGYRQLENQAKLSSVSINPPTFTFNHLGTGNNGTITVQDSRSSSNLGVVISNNGRWIRICPPNCPP